jgi:hypothetical protein
MALSNLDILLVQFQLPGLTYDESLIAKAWLRAHCAAFDDIQFNFRLGQGLEPPPGADAAMVQMTQQITTKRADIVAVKGSDVTLIEVKVRIAFNVIGQLLGYQHLYEQQFPTRRIVRLLAIGCSIAQDAAGAIARQGIDVLLFPNIPPS